MIETLQVPLMDHQCVSKLPNYNMVGLMVACLFEGTGAGRLEEAVSC